MRNMAAMGRGSTLRMPFMRHRMERVRQKSKLQSGHAICPTRAGNAGRPITSNERSGKRFEIAFGQSARPMMRAVTALMLCGINGESMPYTIRMEKTVQAVYEGGVLRPLEPIPLAERQEVTIDDLR